METKYNVGLTFKNRLLLNKLFPYKGSLEDQVIARGLMRRLGVTEEEKKAINFRKEPTGWVWDLDKEEVRNAEFTNNEVEFLYNQVKRLDEEKNIVQDLVDICLKIKMLKEEKDEAKNS